MGVMFRTPSGSVTDLPAAANGAVLYGGVSAPEWRALNAVLVPYISSTSKGFPSVSAALDHLITKVDEMAGRLEMIERAERANTRAVEVINGTMEERLIGMGRRVAEVADAVRSDVHEKVRVSPASNPALRIDKASQEVTLDFAVHGSYYDAVSQLDADTVQGAIEQLSAKVARLVDENIKLREEIAEIRAER